MKNKQNKIDAKIMLKTALVGMGVFVAFYVISPLFGLVPQTVNPSISEVTGTDFDLTLFILMGLAMAALGGWTALGQIPWNVTALILPPIAAVMFGGRIYPAPDTWYLVIPFILTHLIFGLGLAKKFGLKTVEKLKL